MEEYGFIENMDFKTCYPNLGSENYGGQNMIDYQISLDMAKQICMIQRTELGKQYRQYFLDLEKAWNTPEQIFARALKMADKEIQRLKESTKALEIKIEADKPKVLFADSVSASDTSILIRDYAKILRQNGIEAGEKRLYAWFRQNGYIIKNSTQPTQKAMELGLFEVVERSIQRGEGLLRVTSTTRVTGKGQVYFLERIKKVLDKAV